jgi:L-alanine-DL-glutamate epimerase-like enolase superfamily enzyme
VVATGRLLTAQNLFVRITLESGAVGFGEIAPFPEVDGEDRPSCQQVAVQLAKVAIGQPASQYKKIAGLFQEVARSHPAVRCGLETALLDVLCRQHQLPLWRYLGSADVRERETDITIPITELDRTVALARMWYAKGFRLLKTKVGMDVDHDIRRLEAVYQACPDVEFVADANQGFTRAQCRAFAKGVAKFGGKIVVLEQPVPRDDLESLAALRRETGIPVAADESVRCLRDAREVVRQQAADFVNIKIMKSGLLDAMEIAAFVRAAGLRLMIGGMVETRIAMGCSFAMVLGLGGFELLDLDTPLLLARDPVMGGYRYAGPRLQPWGGAGLALEAESDPAVVTVE